MSATTDEVTDEFERQFLLGDTPPPFTTCSYVDITQGYCQKPVPLKLRQQGDDKMLVVKSGTPGHRRQWEHIPPVEVYERLWPCTAGRRMTFRRFTMDHHGWILDLDVCEGLLTGLILLEVESPTQALSDAYDHPGWLTQYVIREVTTDGRYRKRSLATTGQIPEPELIAQFRQSVESL